MYICIILANLVNKVMHEANARINGKFLFFEWINFICLSFSRDMASC